MSGMSREASLTLPVKQHTPERPDRPAHHAVYHTVRWLRFRKWILRERRWCEHCLRQGKKPGRARYAFLATIALTLSRASPSRHVLQQRAHFDTFAHRFNHERPNQALDMHTPARMTNRQMTLRQ
jgi:hypothetical protein